MGFNVNQDKLLKKGEIPCDGFSKCLQWLLTESHGSKSSQFLFITIMCFFENIWCGEGPIQIVFLRCFCEEGGEISKTISLNLSILKMEKFSK